jgi:hypothetical protein
MGERWPKQIIIDICLASALSFSHFLSIFSYYTYGFTKGNVHAWMSKRKEMSPWLFLLEERRGKGNDFFWYLKEEIRMTFGLGDIFWRSSLFGARNALFFFLHR